MSNEDGFVGALRQMLGLNTGSMIVSAALVTLLVKKGIITTEELEAQIKESTEQISEGLKQDQNVERGIAAFIGAIKNASKGGAQ